MALAAGSLEFLDRRNDVDYTDEIAAARRQAGADGDRVLTLPANVANRWSDNGGPTW
ncbi:hypothetical protein GCM10009844_39010 [Nocardioides koreensis]|uniref:Uncharacterized protein n=1 Tax=Nocardioides koreensis TaxID=433651 RepID=A0ABP5LXB5_9ACTN